MNNEIIGSAFCKYDTADYEQSHHIYNVGDRAVITGNGGVYSSCVDYFTDMGGDLKKAYLCYGAFQKVLPKSNFIVGREVKILGRQYWNSGPGLKICLVEVDGWQFVIGMDYLRPITKGEEKMNEIIAELFPKTADAILIQKYFGNTINCPFYKVLIKGKEKELLEEAKRLDEISKKDLKK